ncbi:hypothetical protein GGF31_004528 [Allomyces arbusculus]|nr:hypothetical protein GGF31_004528 [Allomyces arbusculus]
MATISKTPAASSPRLNRRPDRRFTPSSAYSVADANASAWSPAPAPVPDPLADAPPPPHPPAVDFAHGLGDPNADDPAAAPGTTTTSAPTVAQFFGAGAGAPQPPAKLITADYRAMTHSQLNEARGAKSSWDQTFRRCTNPIQLRVTVSRLLAQPAPPVPEDVISALNACARLALLGGKGVAPLMDAVATNQSDVPTSTTSEGESVRRTRADQFQRESFEVAQSIMKALTSRRTIPSLHIYSAYIRVCAHAGQVDAAFQALEDLKRNGIVPDTEIYKGLVMASARQGDLQRALAAVETSVQNASSITRHAKWLSMALRMAVGIEAGKWLGILVSVTTGMHEIATQIIGIGFGTVFGLRLAIPVLMPNATNRDGSIPGLSPPDTQRGHFADAPYQPVEANSVFQSHDANEVNEHMHNFLIATLEKSGNVDGALKILDQMKAKGIPVTVTTYNNLITDLVHLNRPAVALQTIDKMTAIKPTIFTFLPVTQYYYDRRQFDQVIHVYETMMKPRKIQLDLVTYTSIISSYGKANKVDEAMQLFDAFLRDGFHPNYFVLNTLISILANGGRMREAENILLNVMPKYNVHPTLRSYAKLIEKARFIDSKTYTPPPSPDFQPPPFPMHLVQTNGGDTGAGPPTIPIQVQRAWYWYHFLRCTGLQMTIVPTNLLMFVLNSFHLPRVALHVYRDAIQSTAAVPLLVTASRQPAVDPELNTYMQLIPALATDPTVSLDGVLAFVYELKARNAWPYPLPSPRNVPALAAFTDQLVGVRVAPVPPTVPTAVLRRRHAIILNHLLARAVAPPKGAEPADRESKAVLLAICDAFSAVNARFSWVRPESEVEPAPAAATTPLLDILDGGGRDVATTGAVGGGEPPVAALLDEDEDDVDVVLGGMATITAASATLAPHAADLAEPAPARDVAREPETKQQQVGLGFHYILLQRELLEGRKPRTVPGRARHHFDHRHEQHPHQNESTAPAPARSRRSEARLAHTAAAAEPMPRVPVPESRAAGAKESAPKDDVVSVLREAPKHIAVEERGSTDDRRALSSPLLALAEEKIAPVPAAAEERVTAMKNRALPSPSPLSAAAPVESKATPTPTPATSAEPSEPTGSVAKEAMRASDHSRQQSAFWDAVHQKPAGFGGKEAMTAPAHGEKQQDFTVQRGFWDKF